MSKRRAKKAPPVKAVDIDKTATQRGLTGQRLAGFFDAIDVAAYTVKINGMVSCGNTGCGYCHADGGRCMSCPQYDAEHVIGLLYALKA